MRSPTCSPACSPMKGRRVCDGLFACPRAGHVGIFPKSVQRAGLGCWEDAGRRPAPHTDTERHNAVTATPRINLRTIERGNYLNLVTRFSARHRTP
ncbi:hypothetical protein FMEAI12_2290009 [Parafrankia sp. Ea1.12]|nr:hypothetical protein FMEAI12_2290009 [Parafrankia sp. Ea1.12]